MSSCRLRTDWDRCPKRCSRRPTVVEFTCHPCSASAAGSFAGLLHVHRSGDVGCPRVSGSTSASRAATHPALPGRFPDVRRPNAARRRVTACDLTASLADRLPRQNRSQTTPARLRHSQLALAEASAPCRQTRAAAAPLMSTASRPAEQADSKATPVDPPFDHRRKNSADGATCEPASSAATSANRSRRFARPRLPRHSGTRPYRGRSQYPKMPP